MSELHINDFYKDVGKILLQLHHQFPRKCILYVEDISGPDSADEFGLHSERHQRCFGAMIWLAETGYLSYQQTIQQEALDQVVLTEKGFILLASTANDTTLQEQGSPLPYTNAQLIRQTLKQGTSLAINEAILQLMKNTNLS